MIGFDRYMHVVPAAASLLLTLAKTETPLVTPQSSLAQLETQLHLEQQGTVSDDSELMAKFREYKQALAELKSSSEGFQFDPDTLASRLDEQERLQRAIFNDQEVEALFSRRNQADKAALERLRIRQDPQLSPNEQNRLIEENLRAMPSEVSSAYEPTLTLRKAQQIIDSNSPQLREELASRFGEPAAERLHQTLKRQQQWQLTAQALADQWQQLENDASLPVQQRRHLQQQLLVNLSPTEQKRLRTLVLNPALFSGLRNSNHTQQKTVN